MNLLPSTQTLVTGVLVALAAAIAINQLKSVPALRRLLG